MATYYVDNSTGSDADDGLSEANAWQTLAKAALSVAAGDLVNVKNTTDYTLTASLTFGSGGSAAAGPIRFRGYTTSAGDGGRFILKTSTNSIDLVNVNADYLTFQDFELKHQAATRGRGFVPLAADRSNLLLVQGRIEGCTTGIDGAYVTNFSFPGLVCENLEIVDCATAGIINGSATIVDTLIRGCGSAWQRGLFPLAGNTDFVRARIYGSTTHGLHWNSNFGGSLSLIDCVVRACGSDGVRLAHASAAVGLFAENSVIYGNGAYGLTSAAHVNHLLRKCAFRSNTSGNYHATYFTVHLNEIALTADPHTSAAAYDFSLNATAGGGALLRAAGFSGSFGGTGYVDVGGVQHADPPATPPATPTFTVADNANGTGGVVTIAGSTAGSTNTFYAALWTGGFVGASFSSYGSRTGNGTIPIATANGYWWGFVRSELSGLFVDSLVAGFRTTLGGESVYYRCLTAVAAKIQALNLSGIAGSSIAVRKLPWNRNNATPGIYVTPTREVSFKAATNERDDVPYGVQVTVVRASNESLTDGLSTQLAWREQIARALRQEALVGVAEVYTVELEAGSVIDDASFAQHYDVQTLLVRCMARETRGVT